MPAQVVLESELLKRCKSPGVSAHQAQKATVATPYRIQKFPRGQEVLVDQANHVKAVCHDLGLREVVPDQGSVGRRQIQANDPDPLRLSEPREKTAQRGFGTTQNHIVNPMAPQVAERGGIPVFPAEEVFIDAQGPRTSGRPHLGHLAFQIIMERALHRRRPNSAPLGQPSLADPVPVLLEHLPPISFRAAPVRQDPGKPLVKVAPAVQTLKLTGFQPKIALARPQTLVMQPPYKAVFPP